MMSTAAALALTCALSAGTVEPASDRDTTRAAEGPLGRVSVPADSLPIVRAEGVFAGARWLDDRATRPAALPALYAALGAFQVLDVYSTRQALGAGATEVNPAMRASAGSAGAMLAVKALSAAGSIYFTERAWKKNRKGAVVLMALVNGVTAAVAVHNLRNAQERAASPR